MVTVLPPHVVHDGRPATSRGFRKRVLYLETSILGEDLIGPAVDRPVIADRTLRGEISALHDTLGCVDDTLEAETRLAFVAERIRRRSASGRSSGRACRRPTSPSGSARTSTPTSSSR